MAITPKPKAAPATTQQQPNVEELIAKGGKVAGENSTTINKPVSLLLRLPAEMAADIETLRQQLPVRISRHTFILQAVAQHIEWHKKNLK